MPISFNLSLHNIGPIGVHVMGQFGDRVVYLAPSVDLLTTKIASIILPRAQGFGGGEGVVIYITHDNS